MYIQQIGLKNYQAHSNTVVDFIDGDNAIIGPSDSGKTALKRAMECVLYNDHSGTDYIKEGEDKFSVYILFSNGIKITRERGKKLNRYIVEKNGEELVLENFGKNVPKEVTEAHKMYKVKLGKKSDSLFSARQLDGPFFLQNTPEERAAIISSIAKAEVVDEAVSITLSKLRDMRKEKKSLEKENKESQAKLKEYEYLENCKILLDQIKDDFEDLKVMVGKLNVNKANLDKVAQDKIKKVKEEAIIEIYSEIELDLKELELISSKLRESESLRNSFNKIRSLIVGKLKSENKVIRLHDIDDTLEEYLSIEENVNNYIHCKKLLNRKNQLFSDKEILSSKVNNLQGIDDNIEKIDSELIPKIEKYNKLVKTNDDFKSLCTRKENGIKFIENKEVQIKDKIKEYEDGLAALGKCPICFNDINLEKVEEELLGVGGN